MILRAYMAINDINPKENSVYMIGAYHPAEPMEILIEHIKKGREFVRSVIHTIVDPFSPRLECLTMTSGSGSGNPPTSMSGMHSRHFPTART